MKCVVHTAYPHVTKHCILTIAVNSTLPKSVCTIESTVTVERSTSFSLLAPVSERREEARCRGVRQPQTALQRFSGSHRDDGRVSRQVRGGGDLSHGRRLHDARPPLQTRSLCASAIWVWSSPQILGPKRLMPSVKQGTVTDQLAEAIQVGDVSCVHGRSSNDRRSPTERIRAAASRLSSDASISRKRRFWRICAPSLFVSGLPFIYRTTCTPNVPKRFAV